MPCNMLNLCDVCAFIETFTFAFSSHVHRKRPQPQLAPRRARESFRDAGKVRTLANLSKWPPTLIEGLRVLLKGGAAVSRLDDAFGAFGHVDVAQAATGADDRRGGLARAPTRAGDDRRPDLDPGSKLAAARGLAEATARDSLAETLGLEDCDEDDLYAAMDWLLKRQDAIERRLAKRHLKDGALVLYDLTSVWLEGRRCPLGRRGYSRDGKRGKLQIEFGLLCDAGGRPVAVEVFDGNTADPATVGVQIDKLRHRFGFSRVVLVGDRGMLTEARIREEVRPSGLDWISALRGPAVRSLVESGAVQLSLFDETDLVEIRSDAYPGERLMVCRNPLLAEERARKREELLRATEALLDPIAAAASREKRRLKGADKIGVRVGKVVGKYKMAKHFDLDIEDDAFGYRRKPESIAAEAALDGLYVVRTSLAETRLDAEGAVRAYKRLSAVERAFRSLKTVDLKVRPVFHRTADRVRAHVLLCMLAYYVEWHMRARLKPLLFDDHDPGAAEAARTSIVAPAQVSDAAKEKARGKRTANGHPVHSFRTLLGDLATIAKNRVVPRLPGAGPFEVLTRPTALQREAFKLLGVRP